MNLSNKELSLIVGGISGSFLNAMSRIFTTVYNIGYQIGSSLKRVFKRSYC